MLYYTGCRPNEIVNLTKQDIDENGAIASFIGQNYGAKLYDRILKGYKTAFSISLQLGVFLTVALVVFAEPLAQIFVSDVLTITLTTEYLRIVGLSQAFMCIEIMTSGAFNGIGKTKFRN